MHVSSAYLQGEHPLPLNWSFNEIEGENLSCVLQRLINCPNLDRIMVTENTQDLTEKKPLWMLDSVFRCWGPLTFSLSSPLLPLPSVPCPPIPSLWVTPRTEEGGVGKGGRAILISRLASAVSQQQPFSTFALPSESN